MQLKGLPGVAIQQLDTLLCFHELTACWVCVEEDKHGSVNV